MRTDAQGIAKFECEAPDNLTRFRVIAVGQTKASQFGSGDATFAVSKKLLIEPALPRFLREGDEVELRAVARQKVSESENLFVRCTAGGGLELTGDARQEISAEREAPVVVRFKARAKAVGPASVKFEVVSTSKLSDAVEVSLPVAEPAILRKESVSGPLASASVFREGRHARSVEAGARHVQFRGSTTPWLNKLMGLPFLLEYPHGCFEQKSSRLLGYTFLGGLLEYLPDPQARRAAYQHVIGETLREFEAGLLADGRLPYWPGGTLPNDFVTIQGAWCVNQAEEAGFDVPERLAPSFRAPWRRWSRARRPESRRRCGPLRSSCFRLRARRQEVSSAADELFLQRDKLTGEGRAMLAIAMKKLGIEPDKQRRS